MAESSVNGATSVPQTPKPDMDANYEPLSQQQSSANSDMDVDDKAGMIPSEYFNSGANTPTVAVQELSQDVSLAPPVLVPRDTDPVPSHLSRLRSGRID